MLRRWPDFDGFGFNLHSEKGKPGQYIGKVDDCSPSTAAGLRRGDWIVEVFLVWISVALVYYFDCSVKGLCF